MSPRFPIFASSSEARTATLQSLLIAAIVITGLYVAREVLLPLALAILLSFVLTPALLFLRRLKVPRVVGVAIVVAFAFALIFGLGWLMSQQATQLAGDLPRYQHVLAEKISALRKSATGSPALEKATEAIKDLERELGNPTPEPKVGAEPSPPEQAEEGRKPIPVEIHEPPPRSLELFQRIAGTVLPPLATAGIVILFVIFILLQREDLRDRAIRLLGASDMQRTTSAMNDAAERLSKYFLSQVSDQFCLRRFYRAWTLANRRAEPYGVGHPCHAHAVRTLCGPVHCRCTALAAGRGPRTRLDHLPAYGSSLPRLRDDGSGGRATRLWARDGGLADRSHHLDRLLDVAVGTARSPACHAAHCLPRRSRPACRGIEFLRGAARRQASAYPTAELLSTGAHRRFSGSHLPGRACP